MAWMKKKDDMPEPNIVQGVNVGKIEPSSIITPPKAEIPKPPELVDIIANNTELWYKTQVLELLAELVQRMRENDKP